MTEQVFDKLAPVRWRQRVLLSLVAGVWGLLGSSIVVLILAATRWLGSEISVAASISVLVLGPILGLAAGLIWRRTWHDAAVAIDRSYQFKDRATTALEFLLKPHGTAYRALQLQDAIEHLGQVKAENVIPYRMPPALPYVAGVALLAVGLAILPLGNTPIQAALAEPDPAIVAEAQFAEEQVKELEKAAEQEKDPEIEKLVKELRAKIEEMKKPGVDVKEALAKLSEMQAGVQDQQAQFNTALAEQQLQSVGDAMSAAQELQAAAKALMEGKLEKAADELEKLTNPQLDRKELKAVTDKLAKSAEASSNSGNKKLSQATQELSEALKKCDGTCQSAAKKLAGECKKCAGRKKISDLLRQCQSCLSECKGNCQKNSMAKGNQKKKSNSPSSSFGLGTSLNDPGDRTDLNARKNEEKITGQQGDGESEIETSHDVEGKQEASRGYRDQYQKYRKMSDSVLDSEEIPLGHRQMIRKYFELIRPQNGEGIPEASNPEVTPDVHK